MRKIKNLPENDDKFWDGEKYAFKPKSMNICPTHSKDNWLSHNDYIDNKDGTFSCTVCGWGGFLPGYLRVLDGKMIDLRSANRP